MNKQQQQIESLLFFKNEPISFLWIGKQIDKNTSEVKDLLNTMIPFYEKRGLTIVMTDDKASLVTSESCTSLIKNISKSREEHDLSKQALETISIILYKGVITKSELDYIRGVNSIFILRNLLIRGLIEKNVNKKDKRSSLYSITTEALLFLGVNKKEELPQFDYFKDKLNELEKEYAISIDNKNDN